MYDEMNSEDVLKLSGHIERMSKEGLSKWKEQRKWENLGGGGGLV